MSDKICQYGCNQKANYQLKNGKWCCSPKYNSCTNSRRITSMSLKGKMIGENNPMYGKKHTNEVKIKISNIHKGKKLSETHKKRIGDSLKGRTFSDETIEKKRNSTKGCKCYNWKGGVIEKNIPLYDTYAHQIEYAEAVRRNKEDKNILEVRCAYCGKWYMSKRTEIQSRILALNGGLSGEHRLYCSTECKKECPIYNQSKYSKGYKKSTSREVQPELRQLVFKRDDWKCQKCNNVISLHCHHITGIEINPIESADVDNCITLCKKCHKEIHKQKGCRYIDMKRESCIGDING